MISSKERASACSINSRFYWLAVETSKWLSAVPELYDWPQYVNPPKELAKRVSVDYHLVVRLKSLRAINFKRICLGNITQDQLDMFDLAIENESHLENVDTISKSLREACRFGNVEIVDRILKLVLDVDDHNLGSAMSFACSKGHIEIAKKLHHMSPLCYNISRCIMRAYKHNHIDIVDFIKKMKPYHLRDDNQFKLYGLCAGGQLHLAASIGNLLDHNLDWGLGEACCHGQKEAIKIVIELGARNCDHCDRGAWEHL
jgi:hypothetical protein